MFTQLELKLIYHNNFLLEGGKLKQHSRLNSPLGFSSCSFINFSQVTLVINFLGGCDLFNIGLLQFIHN